MCSIVWELVVRPSVVGRLRSWRGRTVLDEVAAPSRKSVLGCIEGYRFVEEVVIIIWSVMLILLVDRGLGADDGCRTVLDGVS